MPVRSALPTADIRDAVHDPTRLTAAQREQLHALTCATGCGARDLVHDGGHAYVASGTDGGRLGYAVRLCAQCATRRT
ncbi:hypothetical protein [Streptomyces omiyaensis]|uniref:hypothetical protein n=1 Tax=Streptomyces omiyaensis TaxID=68247 RepID=UPI00167838E7|nr:hypothetical protein [Streptomyces omiyaensis]